MPTTPRNTRTITFSLSPAMAEQVKAVMHEERRTMSELIREALRNYMEEREWVKEIRYDRLKKREAKREKARRRAEE